MSIVLIILGICTALMFIYLLVAILKPELFS